MQVSQAEWLITVGLTVAVLLFDIVIVARKPHEPTLKESAIYLGIYVAMAIAFGIWVTIYHDTPFVNGGRHVNVPQIPTLLSLAVIVLTLTATAVISLVVSSRRARTV